MQGKLIDLTGQKFGAWTVIEKTPRRGSEAYWLCRCECGTEREIRGWHLRTLRTKSCGCLTSEYKRIAIQKHGESKEDTPLYRKWRHMIGNKIPVCKEWKDFFTFATWAQTHGYRRELFLSRIDLRFGWYPENTCFRLKQNHPKGIVKHYPPIPKIRKDGTRRAPNVD